MVKNVNGNFFKFLLVLCRASISSDCKTTVYSAVALLPSLRRDGMKQPFIGLQFNTTVTQVKLLEKYTSTVGWNHKRQITLDNKDLESTGQFHRIFIIYLWYVWIYICIYIYMYIYICMYVYIYGLTHWGRINMAAIFQTTFSNAFSWMKNFTTECS